MHHFVSQYSVRGLKQIFILLHHFIYLHLLFYLVFLLCCCTRRTRTRMYTSPEYCFFFQVFNLARFLLEMMEFHFIIQILCIFFFCLLLGPPGFKCWFSFAPVFQWCCSTPQGSPGVGRTTRCFCRVLIFISLLVLAVRIYTLVHLIC